MGSRPESGGDQIHQQWESLISFPGFVFDCTRHLLHSAAPDSLQRMSTLYEALPLGNDRVDSIEINDGTERAIAVLRRTIIQCVVFLLSAAVVVLVTAGLHSLPHSNVVPLTSMGKHKHTAYVLSTQDDRYIWTIAALERGFPSFFDIHRISPVPLNDNRVVRVASGSVLRSQKLTVVDTWREFSAGQATRHLAADDWMFFFEDDVNVWSGAGDHFDFGPELQHLLDDPLVREDGMVYLGKCGGDINWNSTIQHSSVPSPGLISARGYGVCNHALAFTKRRATAMIADIGLWVPAQSDHMDQTLERFVITAMGDRWPMVFGASAEGVFPDHRGVVFQDRRRWPSNFTWK